MPLARKRRPGAPLSLDPHFSHWERCGLTILNTQQRATIGEGIFGGAPPHNIEAEQCLLGAILITNKAFAHAERHVAADDFFEPIHRQIFEACASLIGAGKLASPITLKTFLPPDFDIEGLKLGRYIARLAVLAYSGALMMVVASAVRDLANRRRHDRCRARLHFRPEHGTAGDHAGGDRG